MLAGIKDILIITRVKDFETFKNLLGDGYQWGIRIYYAIQDNANGLPEAFIIGEQFINDDNVCMILGDNVFIGNNLSVTLQEVVHNFTEGAMTIGYHVANPKSLGVAYLSENGNVINIEEKPENPKSNVAITGLYFLDNTASDRAKGLKPSKRNELEIVDLLKTYLVENKLKMKILGRGFSWQDTGTPNDLLEAANYIAITEKRQGLKIGDPNEVAYRMGFISKNQLIGLANQHRNDEYKKYLLSIIG